MKIGRKRSSIGALSALLTFMVVLFQNCSQWQGQVSLAPSVGALKLKDPSLCTASSHYSGSDKILEVWTDSDADGEGDQWLGDIVSFKGEISSVENYNYYSASAHPVVGAVPAAETENVYFYEGSDGLTLNVVFNKEEGDSSTLKKVYWAISTTGNNLEDTILLEDDPESDRWGQSVVEGIKTYKLELGFHLQNTDGGVIGPFNGEDFMIKIDKKIAAYNDYRAKKLIFNSKDGQAITLDFSEGSAARTFEIRPKQQVLCDSQ